MDLGGEISAGAQPREGTDHRAVADGGADDVAHGADLHALADADAGAEDHRGSITVSRPITVSALK